MIACSLMVRKKISFVERISRFCKKVVMVVSEAIDNLSFQRRQIMCKMYVSQELIQVCKKCSECKECTYQGKHEFEAWELKERAREELLKMKLYNEAQELLGKEVAFSLDELWVDRSFVAEFTVHNVFLDHIEGYFQRGDFGICLSIFFEFTEEYRKITAVNLV